MTLYTVTWTTEIDAETAEDAARQALEVQRDKDSVETVFAVALVTNPGSQWSSTKDAVRVDVEERVCAAEIFAATRIDQASYCEEPGTWQDVDGTWYCSGHRAFYEDSRP